MAKTYSQMVELGSKAPRFKLPNTTNQEILEFQDCKKENGTLVMFICNHCPFVVHVKDQLVQLARDYMPKGIGVVAISSNDIINYPEDSPEKMADWAQAEGFLFPYLYDESQQTAKDYGATCTPDFFLYDSSDLLVYRGQLDDSRPGNEVHVDGKDLRLACESLLTGQKIPNKQKPSIGCNIKWKS